MKYLKKVAWLGLITTVLLTSCQDDRDTDTRKVSELTVVAQAREFFENTIIDAATRGILVQDKDIGSPGEVTPRWEEAQLKILDGQVHVYVPILAENLFVARETVMRDSIEKTYHVPVYQLLCFRANEPGIQDAYYLSLIPSKGYYSTNKNSVVERYIKNEGMHGNFTGRVVYTDLVYFNALAVDKVIDGEYEWGFSWWTVPSEKSFWRNYRKMFKNIDIVPCRNTRTIYDGGEMDPAETTGSSGGGSGSSGSSGGSGSLGGRGGITDWSGGSTGGSGSGGSQVKVNYANSNIPKTFPIQSSENTCTTATMAIMMEIFGKEVTEKILNDLIKNMGYDINEKQGLQVWQIEKLVESWFQTQTFTSYEGAISRGCVVYTTYGQHAVIIVGYIPSNGKFEIIDPVPEYGGKPRQVSRDLFSDPLYNYAIDGIKF